MNKQLRLVHLQHARHATRPFIKRYLQYDPELEILYKWNASELSNHFLITIEKSRQLVQDLHSRSIIHSLLNNIKQCKIVTIYDEEYPDLLRNIYDPPFVLYAKGDITLLNKPPLLSVIGTRYPTREAESKVSYLLNPLIQYGFTIVSGMAMGIDGMAHRKALELNGKTIAVLGSGFEYIYPKVHETLFHKIMQHNLVISEYPPNTPPRKHHFPERNRIISGLSFGTVVIEAKERSGSLITVDQALEQGREVYAVPGSILAPQSIGCHQMIMDGAKLVQNTHEIIADWEEINRK